MGTRADLSNPVSFPRLGSNPGSAIPPGTPAPVALAGCRVPDQRVSVLLPPRPLWSPRAPPCCQLCSGGWHSPLVGAHRRLAVLSLAPRLWQEGGNAGRSRPWPPCPGTPQRSVAALPPIKAAWRGIWGRACWTHTPVAMLEINSHICAADGP